MRTVDRGPPRKPNWQIGKGLCVWCGRALQGKRRSWCGNACVTEYRIANFNGDAVSALRKRDGGICACCGTDARSGDGWDADHIVPLWAVDRDAPDAFRFWTMANLQTLCRPCHKIKTAREARERASARRRPGIPAILTQLDFWTQPRVVGA